MDLALIVHIADRAGVLHALTGVISSHGANIAYVDLTDRRNGEAAGYFELEDVADPATLERDLRELDAVKEVREKGIIVISLNMVGSVPKAADLVVTDPIQAGVMAVMAVADTATFDIALQRGRTY